MKTSLQQMVIVCPQCEIALIEDKRYQKLGQIRFDCASCGFYRVGYGDPCWDLQKISAYSYNEKRIMHDWESRFSAK